MNTSMAMAVMHKHGRTDGHRHMVAWVYGVRLITDIESHVQVHHARMARSKYTTNYIRCHRFYFVLLKNTRKPSSTNNVTNTKGKPNIIVDSQCLIIVTFQLIFHPKFN